MFLGAQPGDEISSRPTKYFWVKYEPAVHAHTYRMNKEKCTVLSMGNLGSASIFTTIKLFSKVCTHVGQLTENLPYEILS